MTEKQTDRTLGGFIRKLGVAGAVGHRNLTLVPLRGEGHGRLDYILSAQAIEAGTLTVTEVDESGSVPELLADNAGDKMILLLDGEELVGAKQNRILNASILLRPKSKTKIPVSCVEEGRWHHTSMAFSSGGYSPARLRARKSRDVGRNLRQRGQAQSDQGAVWEEVSDNIEALGAMSPTMAMHDVVEQQSKSIAGYVEALRYPEGARGVIAAINGRFVALDLFDQPETLERVWPRLVTGYAMDAIAATHSRKQKPQTFSSGAAGVLIEHVGQLPCDACPTVGLGKDWRFEAEDVVGQALVSKRACVHLSAFPNDETRRQETPGPRILPPSHRRRTQGEGRQSNDAVH